jgi:hypothetical protein
MPPALAVVTRGGRARHTPAVLFFRYEADESDDQGRHVGVFGLVNGLGRSGVLSLADHAWWRANNAWFDAAYRNPGASDPTIFDVQIHPRTSCWFKASAGHLLERVPGYLALLDRYGVAWTERRSGDPGVVIYEDADQVVVVPYPSGR